MDCLTARRVLDLYPLDGVAETLQTAAQVGPTEARNGYEESATLADGLLAESHLAECSKCQVVVESRRRFDRRVGQVFRDVPVPVGLKEHLLAMAAAIPASVNAPSSNSASIQSPIGCGRSVPSQPVRKQQVRKSSRRWMWVTASACLLLIAVGLSIFWRPAPAAVPFELVLKAATAPTLSDDGPFTSFTSPHQLQLPETGRVEEVIQSSPRLVVVHGQRCAGYSFSLQSRAQTVRGRLLILPRSAVQNPVASGTMQTFGSWSVAVWPEGDLVYVLAVDGHEELERLVPQSVTF